MSNSPGLPPVYQSWLDQDVRWIITPEERAAFIRLSKDEERDNFVEQFWLRRDPTPTGATENKFKEEHYRRIAYANVHFAQAIPGWERDRGRIYIVYGPPDEKVQSAHGNAGPENPTERWHYRIVPKYGKDVDFKFVDGCKCGDYRLATP